MTTKLVGGRYEVLRKIAEGGMGAVFEARHHMTKKVVALKVLFPHIGKDEAAKQRFLREVSAPATIGHPGIVEVYDSGFDPNDGSLFVAMEFLQGETLRDWIARGGHIHDRIFDLFEEMLEPLAAAHQQGIVHRDLKPENIFLAQQRDGSTAVKILDFGIARDLDTSQDNVTRTGIAMGTPHYMAPEQAMSARGVLPAADVWAIGAMLYEALTGQTPFQGETASAIVVHACTQPHPPIATVVPSLPPALAALVDACLDKKPAERPETAGKLLETLRRLRGGAPATAPSAGESTAVVPPTSHGFAQPEVGGLPPTGAFAQSPEQATAPGGFATPQPNAGSGSTAGGFGAPSPGGFGAPQQTPSPGGFGAPQQTPSPGGFGAPQQTPSPGGFGAPQQTPSPGGFGSSPGGFGSPGATSGGAGPAGFGAPSGAAAPGAAPMGTPAPKQKSMAPKILVGIGAFIVLGCGTCGGLVMLGGSDDEVQPAGVATAPVDPAAAGAAGAAGTPAAGVGTVIVLTEPGGGELLVDGQSHGPVGPNQSVSLGAGAHRLELRIAGSVVGAANVNVQAGGSGNADLRRGAGGERQQLSGTLGPGDSTLQSGEYSDDHTFNWAVGSRVTVTMRSSDLDPYLIVKRPSNTNQLDNDDMSAGVRDASLTFEVTESGTWHVLATTYQPGESGSYTIELSVVSP